MANYTFSAEQRRALQTVMGMEESERVELQKRLLAEKWADWLGDKSVEQGFPAVRANRRGDMALILENQMKFQGTCERRTDSKGRIILQDVTTGDEALPTRFSLPLVRRVYAPLLDRDFGDIQPMPGPTAYVFWMDFVREANNSNLLSLSPSAFVTAEQAPPAKGKVKLVRSVVTAQKNLIGMSLTTESIEDARAQLGLDVESELQAEFALEIQRDLMGRHLSNIITAAQSGTNSGSNLPTNSPSFVGPNPSHVLPDRGSNSVADYKGMIYNGLIDADTDFQKYNRIPSDGIIAGRGLAALIGKLITATSATNPEGAPSVNQVGWTNFGTFAGRWTVIGTEFLGDNVGFLYRRNPSRLQAGHVYCPYVPVQVMPTVYGGYDASTGNYQNTDEWTRNLRERSADIVTKGYAFQPITGPAGGLSQM